MTQSEDAKKFYPDNLDQRDNHAVYYLHDGSEVTIEEVKQAHANGMTRLMHSHGDGQTETALSIAGQDIDTRGECYSMWEEVWTTVPETIEDCVEAWKA